MPNTAVAKREEQQPADVQPDVNAGQIAAPAEANAPVQTGAADHAPTDAQNRAAAAGDANVQGGEDAADNAFQARRQKTE